MTPRLPLFLAAALLGALQAPAGCDDPDARACPACAAPSAAGALERPKLDETSGLAASAVHDDVFYAHNDAGDSSRFFAFSRAGADLGVFKLADAQNVDWEDMAQGPCDPPTAASCLYLGDIGDNTRERLAYALYRLPEPAAVGPGERTVAAERIVFTYPDGPHDAEALLVHPRTGTVTIVTKTAEPAAIFELTPPLTADRTHTAADRGELDPPNRAKITGGAVHPAGTGVLLRTTHGLLFYPMRPEQSVAEALRGDPCELPAAAEPNGEAVTWLRSGAGVLTIGEGEGAPLNLSTCEP